MSRIILFEPVWQIVIYHERKTKTEASSELFN